MWWNDDKDEAIAEFTKVAEASKAESDLRLDLAELLEQQGERADALALADVGSAAGQRHDEAPRGAGAAAGGLDRRPRPRPPGGRAALRPAARHRHPGPARRPDAPARPARAGRGRAGPRPPPRRQQGHGARRPDAPVPAPGQARRRRAGRHADPPLDDRDPPDQPQRLLSADNPDASRVAAIGVLARSGRLAPAHRPGQRAAQEDPQRHQLHQALADYYKAAGQRDKARAELAKIIALRPDDSSLRLQIAQQLVQEGQAAAAIEHYKVILKKDPAVLARNFYQVQNAFQQAGKTGELMDLLEQIDLRQFGQPYIVFNLISNLFYDNKLRDRAMPLFKERGKPSRTSDRS